LKQNASPVRLRKTAVRYSDGLLVDIIYRSPEEFGIPAQLWDLANLAVVARSEGILPDVSYWTLRREIVRLINLHPDLQSCVDIANQKQPGAPLGNRNAVKHGAYAEVEPPLEELALIADVKARFLDDFPDSDEDDIKLIRTAAEACVRMNRALAADCADAAMRADRRFRKAIKALKAKKMRRGGKLQTTPADWAANLLKHFENA